MGNMFFRKLTTIMSVVVSLGVSATVKINEIMPCNITAYMDGNTYDFPSWVEFYNDGDPVDLKGATVTAYKSSGKVDWSGVFQESHKIPAGYSILAFYGDVETKPSSSTILGSYPKSLEYKAGKLEFVFADGSEVSLTHPLQLPNVSYCADGFMEPTPGKKNSTAYKTRVPAPTFKTKPGFYFGEEEKKIELVCEIDSAKIYYTTDGSTPTEESKLYEGPFEIHTNHPIRAKAYVNGQLASDVLTGTFILESPYKDHCKGDDLPVVCICTDDVFLNDDEIGICTKGKNGVAGASSCVSAKANYNRDWNRPAYFEYFEDGALKCSQKIEIGVTGGCSRQDSYKTKSLKMKASKKTGNNRLGYTKFFKEKDFSEMKSVQIRNGGNAYGSLRCRDGFMQSIGKGLGVDYQGYQPVAYYLNGKYQGLMGLRERTNEDYIFHNYGLEEEEIDEISIKTEKISAVVGTRDAYDEMISYVENHYSDPDFYQQLSKRMDVEEYIHWQILEQFVVNTDWPGNNTKIWRKRNGGKFRWIVYDTDFGYGMYEGWSPNYCNANMNMMDFAMGVGEAVNWANGTDTGGGYRFDEKSKWKTTLFYHCMQNGDFKLRFVTEFLKQLNTRFTEDKIMAKWDSVSSLVKKDFCATEAIHGSVDDYTNGIKSFTADRCKNIKSQLLSKFKMSDSKVKFNFEVVLPDELSTVDFLFNKELMNGDSYTYNCYDGQRVKIEPQLPAGYRVQKWYLSDPLVESNDLITKSTQWSYFYDSIMPAKNWMDPDYDDSEWKVGKGKFGYASDRDYDTKLNYGKDKENKYITAYFRTSVDCATANDFKEISVNVMYDDAVVVYVNGKVVKVRNLPKDTTYSYDMYAELEEGYANDEECSFKIDGSLFKKGKNVIAVEVHQNEPGSSDMTMKFTASYESSAKSEVTGDVFEGNVGTDMTVKLYVEEDPTYVRPQLFINEICSSNNRIQDEYGEKPDWIEIYNAGETDVDLADMVLVNLTKQKSHVFPRYQSDSTVVPAKGRVLLWADGNAEGGPLHLGFKLSALVPIDLALIQKYKGENDTLDVLTAQKHAKNGSYGRETDGSSELVEFTNCSLEDHIGLELPTPRLKNGSLLCDTPTGDDSIESNVTVYPNPVDNILYVEVRENGAHHIQIVDCLSRRVAELDSDERVTEIDVNSLSSGVYVITVNSEDAIYTTRFIKK
ncbi:MAG: CotH kinase family protein [Bacteroidales bacterium]|nr:CotH kinase family protein [Candidatus Scybalocola fimicaballi]